MDNLLTQIKLNTFIFTDEEIKNKLNKVIKDNSNSIVLQTIRELYEDKGFITKEEYKKEIIDYLYANSDSSTEKIENLLDDYKDSFYDYYDLAVKGEKTFYHAVFIFRNSLMSFLHYKSIENLDNDLDILEDEPDF